MNTNLLALKAYKLHRCAEKRVSNYSNEYVFNEIRFCDFLDKLSESIFLNSHQLFELSQSASYLYEQLEHLIYKRGYVMSNWMIKNDVTAANLVFILLSCIDSNLSELN